MTCRVSDLIGPAFAKPHSGIKSGKYSQLVLKGGRGSGKSSYAAIEGVLLLLQNPLMHGVVMRKVAATLRTSVYAQYCWAVDVLGLGEDFIFTLSPLEVCYKATGQKLLFMGADDQGKLKSLKFAFGYAGFLHLEELDQFDGEREVRSIEQSVLRSGVVRHRGTQGGYTERACRPTFEIKTFNPPRSRSHWANRYCERHKPGQLIHHTTYRDLPESWLGARFIQDAEYLQSIDPAAYEHEYGGVPNGSGGMVFANLAAERIPDECIASFERVYCGVDWGYWPDPFVFIKAGYHAAKRILYIYDEIAAHKLANHESAQQVKKKTGPYDVVICDSAEPKSIADYRAGGIRAQAAEKSAGSLVYSMKWLQGLARIVIDPERCPVAYSEFSGYRYKQGRGGEILPGYPDKDNHAIDAVRYAMTRVWSRRGKHAGQPSREKEFDYPAGYT